MQSTKIEKEKLVLSEPAFNNFKSGTETIETETQENPETSESLPLKSGQFKENLPVTSQPEKGAMAEDLDNVQNSKKPQDDQQRGTCWLCLSIIDSCCELLSDFCAALFFCAECCNGDMGEECCSLCSECGNCCVECCMLCGSLGSD